VVGCDSAALCPARALGLRGRRARVVLPEPEVVAVGVLAD
jgi:hypothetical protein